MERVIVREVVVLLVGAVLSLGGCGRPRMQQAASPSGPPTVWNVRDYGAVGDGSTKDTAAVQKALDVCAVNGGGEVVVPEGHYLIGSIQLGQRTTLRLAKEATLVGSPDLADYPMIDVRWEGKWQPGHRALIYAANVDHIGIVGAGHIVGEPKAAAPQNPRGAVVLEAISCNDVRWEDFSIDQGGNWATHPTYCDNVRIRNVTIVSRRDGIDVDSCSDVRIEGCSLDTGDDSISLKSGRGMDGARIGRPTSGVMITHCTMIGRNFACVGIGSETSAGVKDVSIEHCKMTAARDCIYIKTRIGRAGVTENIHGTDLDIGGGGFLRINLTSAGNTNTADDPVPGLIGYPTARDLSFSDIRLEHAALVADVSKVAPERPVEGLTLSHIAGTADWGIGLVHVRDASISDVHVTGLKGPLLGIEDVTGTGLEGAGKYVPAPSAPARRRRPEPSTARDRVGSAASTPPAAR